MIGCWGWLRLILELCIVHKLLPIRAISGHAECDYVNHERMNLGFAKHSHTQHDMTCNHCSDWLIIYALYTATRIRCNGWLAWDFML